MSLGERIKEIMKLKSLTQEQLGEKVDYSGVAIGKLIKGTTEPKFKFFKGIAEHYPDVNLTWLITGIGSSRSSDMTDPKTLVEYFVENHEILMEEDLLYKEKIMNLVKDEQIKKYEQKLAK